MALMARIDQVAETTEQFLVLSIDDVDADRKAFCPFQRHDAKTSLLTIRSRTVNKEKSRLPVVGPETKCTSFRCNEKKINPPGRPLISSTLEMLRNLPATGVAGACSGTVQAFGVYSDYGVSLCNRLLHPSCAAGKNILKCLTVTGAMPYHLSIAAAILCGLILCTGRICHAKTTQIFL
jgi:hypothetical protein